ncbi:MAG: hypothetical protein QW767_05515 [Thermoprotei archaeon]
MSNSTIIQDTRNPLTKRREVTLRLFVSAHEPTPSRAKLQGQLADSLSTSKEQVVLKKIRHVFGSTEVMVSAHVYDTPEAAKLYERGYLLERSSPKEKKTEAGQAPAQAPEAGKAEPGKGAQAKK